MFIFVQKKDFKDFSIMKIGALLILSLFTSTTIVLAQHTNFNTQRNWSLNKKELIIGIGATQFTGDLGGGNRIGKDYSLADIDFPATGIGGVIGFRYRFHPYWATSFNLNGGLLRGNDANTQEIIRRSRNLNFRTIYFEYQQRIECILYSNEKFGARYRIHGMKFMKDHNQQLYVYSGLGVMYYNPKGLYNGSWVALKPLHTEGQGLASGPAEYSNFTMTIPFGVGFRFGIGRMWRLAIEATYIKTFSDYIDDVHGNYVDPSLLNSAQAQYLSNPSQNNTSWFTPGSQRGDKQNDAYYTVNLVFQRNITYKDYGSQRKKYHWNRGRYKF